LRIIAIWQAGYAKRVPCWSNLEAQEIVAQMLKLCRFSIAVLAVFSLAIPLACAQQPALDAPKEDPIRAHYTKYEFRIPMRDGKRLFTAVYVPKDAASGPYPFMMDRTPYSVGRMCAGGG
jgi:predicted acyl esterase